MADGSVILDAIIESKGFEKAIERMEQAVKSGASSIEKNISGITDSMNDAAKAADKIVIEPTTKGIGAAEKELKLLEKQYDELAAAAEEAKQFMDSVGGTMKYDTSMTRKIVKDYEDAASAADGAASKIFSMNDAISSAKTEMAEGEQAAKAYKEEQQRMTQEQKNAESATRAFETAMNAFVTQVLAKAISQMNKLVTSTFEFRREMAIAETNLSRMGQNTELVGEYMEQFSIVSSNTSQNLEAVSNLLASGFEGNELAKAIDAVSGAVVSFPGLTVDRIAEGIQRSFGEGRAVENFAELIRRTGGDIDAFDVKMSRANSDVEKQNIIMQELSRMGLSETLQLYKEMNPEMVAASKSAYDLATAESRLGEALQPIKNQIDEITAGLLEHVAAFVEANPEVAAFAIGAAYVGTALLGVSTAVKLISSVFGGIPSLFKGTATATKEVAETASAAGSAAGKSATQLLAFGASVLMIGAGVAIAVLALNELAQTFSESEKSAIELGVGIGIVAVAVAGGIALIASVGNAAAASTPQLLAFGVAIALIATSVAILVTALAQLAAAINGLPSINIGAGNSGNINFNGYAKGTQSAGPGLRWVGENGPELMRFRGGEQILNAHQSMARTGALAGVGTSNVTNNYYATIDSRTVESFNDVVKVFDGYDTSIKQGYTGR